MKKLNFKKRVYLSISLMLLFILTSSNFAFAAQSNVDSFNVFIKPEYDSERKVFLQYTGQLPQANNSTKIIFYTPKELIEDSTLHFCAIPPGGEHQCQLREKTVEGDLYKYDIAMPEKEFAVEGYFESIKDSGGKKTLDYTFKAGQDIDQLNINIAQPKNSTDFKVTPSAQSTNTDNDGLNNAVYSFSKVKAGKEYKFRITYVKKGWEVFLERSGMGSAATATNTGGGANVSTLGIIGAILAALLVAGGGLFAFAKFGGQGGVGGMRPSPVAPKGKSRFCSNCGTRIAGGKFCPNCGAKAPK